MPHEYTRQRQGRDFFVVNYLCSTEMSTGGKCNPINGIIGNNGQKDDTELKKTIFDRLEHYKIEAERNAAPVDGKEPPEKRRERV